MSRSERFARRLFIVAGLYGLIVLPPMYFAADMIGEQDPPAITHREFYYGFVGVAIAWQVLFLILATNPLRFRPMIVPAVLEKLGYGVAVMVLAAQGSVTAGPIFTGSMDLVFAGLFAWAFIWLGREARSY